MSKTEKIVLITTDEWKWGQTNTVSALGTIEIDKEGKIYVEPHLASQAQALVDKNINFYFEGQIPEKKITVVDGVKKDEPEEEQFSAKAVMAFQKLQRELEELKKENQLLEEKNEQLHNSLEEYSTEFERLEQVIESLKNPDEDTLEPQVENEDDLSKKKESDDLEKQVDESEVLDEEKDMTPITKTREFLPEYTTEQSEFIDMINAKTVPELRKTYCSQFPKKEWEDLKGSEVRRYLIRKIIK